MYKTIFFLILIVVPMCVFSQISYIAHRGASFLAPENTVASAKLAWKMGADAVEIDIHLSQDNRIMVYHDKNTKKLSGQNHVIKETRSEALRQLDVGSYKGEQFKGEKIPCLEEILETVPDGKTLVVEIKCDNEVLPFLKTVIDASGKSSQVAFIAFGWETILATKKMFPENKCYWLSAIRPGLKSRMKQAAEKGLDGVNLRYSLINESIMEHAKSLGLEILSWTIDDPEEAKRLIDLGVRGITTNRPSWLKKQL